MGQQRAATAERRTVAKDLRRHAPDLTKSASRDLADLVLDGEAFFMVVLAADIRKSAFAMKEALNPLSFAATLGNFIGAAEWAVKRNGGWFDKFTGDGFLAYWPLLDDGHEVASSKIVKRSLAAVDVAEMLLDGFRDEILPDLRLNAQNMDADLGLSIGIDAGLAFFAKMASEVTVVGRPVVGAVRMVDTALPWEVLANVTVGERLRRSRRADGQVEVTRLRRDTKDRPHQEVYRLTLPGFHAPEV